VTRFARAARRFVECRLLLQLMELTAVGVGWVLILWHLPPQLSNSASLFNLRTATHWITGGHETKVECQSYTMPLPHFPLTLP